MRCAVCNHTINIEAREEYGRVAVKVGELMVTRPLCRRHNHAVNQLADAKLQEMLSGEGKDSAASGEAGGSE